MMTDLASLELSPAQFQAVSEIVHRISGIHLQAGKEGLVKTRLAKRLRDLGLTGYGEYLQQISADEGEMALMVDLLTTNKTSFFRESQHFDFLREQLLSRVPLGGGCRIWSAGCSSGEEPYTMAMVLREALSDVDGRDVRILATDISARVLERAKAGVYTQELLQEVPAPLRQRYWSAVPGQATMRASDSLRRMIRFARLNLMEGWPMKGPFDAIFCRNVMIYFDRPTQERLVNRFWELLPPGGHLFVGHSESLTALSHPFQYVQPALYRKAV